MVNLACFLDSTDLRPDATEKDIEDLCTEAVKYKMAAVCIHPYRIRAARRILSGTGIKLATVIGFPLGADGMENKVYSAARALDYGADELDMVINMGAWKDKNYDAVKREIDGVLALKGQWEFILKLIVETALLSRIELAQITSFVNATGADYIKTSTGFSNRGVILEDIKVIKEHKTDALKIKAAGGIRDLNFALELIEAGADRLGTSSAGKLLKEQRGLERSDLEMLR